MYFSGTEPHGTQIHPGCFQRIILIKSKDSIFIFGIVVLNMVDQFHNLLDVDTLFFIIFTNIAAKLSFFESPTCISLFEG